MGNPINQRFWDFNFDNHPVQPQCFTRCMDQDFKSSQGTGLGQIDGSDADAVPTPAIQTGPFSG